MPLYILYIFYIFLLFTTVLLNLNLMFAPFYCSFASVQRQSWGNHSKIGASALTHVKLHSCPMQYPLLTSPCRVLHCLPEKTCYCCYSFKTAVWGEYTCLDPHCCSGWVSCDSGVLCSSGHCFCFAMCSICIGINCDLSCCSG